MTMYKTDVLQRSFLDHKMAPWNDKNLLGEQFFYHDAASTKINKLR